MKKRITESRVITKNVYKDYHLLKIHNGPSIQFKKSGNDYIVRIVTAPHTVDKNELKKMGFGTQSNAKNANDYNFTNGIQMNDVTLNKSQFEKLVSVVEKAYKAFIADIMDFYSRGKILDDVRGARRVNEGVRISLFDPNKNKILKTLSVDRNYREAEKEVETLNKRLSTSEKNKGYYWKITTIGESVNEDVSVKDGKYHFYSKDGLAYLKYNGKEIASGDFDFEGGNTYWLNHSSWKGQKAFDSGKEAIAYFKKNQIVSESGGTLKIEKGKDGKYYWEFKFNSGKVEKWPHGFDDKASAQRDFMYRMKYLSENSKDFNSFMKNVKQFESVNESKYNKDLDKIEAAVKNAKSFMGIGAELKKAGIKYDFTTSMIPMYMIKVPGNTIAVVNKKYAAGAEREVGDTAIGLLETKSIKESKFKSGDKVTVKYPTLVKPIKGVVSNILKGPDGDIVVLKGNNGVWDEKYVSLAEALTKSNLRNTIKSIIREETEYQQFFKKALEKAGKSIPDMSDEEKRAFFNKIDAAWQGKGEKNEELVGNQHKLDVDGDGEIEASDLAALRAGKKVDEGIWPKSKLPQSFQFALAPELKKNFKGIFYSVGNDIYHNDKKVLSVDGDRDSVNSIIKQLKSKIKEAVNEDNGNLMKIGSTMTVGGDGSGMIKPAKMKLISIDYLPNEKDYSYTFKGGGRTQYYMGSTLAKKLKGKSVNEGKKVFKVNAQIGKSKYSVSSHDGVSTHKDGSPFWDIKIFSNKAEMERGIADLKKQGYIQEALFRRGKTRNRSIKENATRTAAEIGSLTGMNKNFIQKFIDDNKLDIEKVFQYVKGGKTKDRMDFVTALSGKPGNTYQKKLIKMFGEGINEDCGCNSVNEVSIDAVRKNALNDKNTSNWKLDAGIKKRMQTRSQFGNLTSSNDVKFLTSPKVKVIDLGKDDVYIFTDGEREMIFRLPERGAEAYNFYKLKSLSKARPVVSTYYTDKVKD